MLGNLLFLPLVLAMAGPGPVICSLTPAQTYFATSNNIGGMVQRPDGRILVADTGRNRVLEFSESLSLLSIHTFAGSDYALFGPAGFAIDQAGNVYIANQFKHCIVKCNSAMTPIAQWGTLGTGPGQLQHPTNLAFSPDGTRLYVTEITNDRVSIFDPNGGFIGSFGSSGTNQAQFDNPFGIAVDAVGNVFVSDVLNQRIQVFTPDGIYQRYFGWPGTAPGQFNYPSGIYFDSSWNLYVADQLNNRIQVVTAAGEPICQFGSGPGQGPGYLWSPFFAGPLRDGSVLVGDTQNFRLVMYILGATPTRAPSWGAIKTLYR